MANILKNAAVSITARVPSQASGCLPAQTCGLIPTETPGNFMDPNPAPVAFTAEFTQSLNDAGRELADAIAQVTGKI